MMTSKIFVSHSSSDKEFALLLVDELKTPETEPWIDHEQIYAGDDVFDEIGEGLSPMDVFILLISRNALDSGWVDLETKYAQLKELHARRNIILAYRLDDVSIDEIPWFIQLKHVPVIKRNIAGVKEIVSKIEYRIKSRIEPKTVVKERVLRDTRIDEIIKDIKIAEWEKAECAALKIMKYTNERGYNELFESLISYLYSEEFDQRFIVGMVIDRFSDLAPWLYDISLLNKLGNHYDFSVRSNVANICFGFAQWAPYLVPIDLIFKLAHHEEDYYVNAPATGALKTLCRHRPTVRRELYQRLKQEDKWAREHIANIIHDISLNEPEILDAHPLIKIIRQLNLETDKNTITLLVEAISNIKQSKANESKYSIFF